MKHAAYLWVALILSMILIIALFWRVLRLDSQVQSLNQPNTGGLVALQDSLKRTQSDLASIKELAPGLGEYMTTIQLHAGKLWFASKVATCQSAEYEKTKKRKTPAHFQKSYDETLSACNGCHTETGHKFIQIIRPNAPPVTNQRWEMSQK